MEFKADFITREGCLYSVLTDKINAPSLDGRRTILSNHMPILLPIQKGVIETSYLDKSTYYVVDDGVIHFEDNHANILISNVIPVTEINIEEVNKNIDVTTKAIEVEENQYRLNGFKKDLAWFKTLVNAYNRFILNK